jgi:spore germination cell wall hydrolase CwlJ-like protein
VIPEHLLEEAAVRYLIDIGQNPLHFSNEIGLQPVRIRKIMSSYMMRSAPPQVVEAVKPQGRKHLLVNSASSTWKTKTIAGIALLASMGLGSATIARMIKRPEQEVKQVIELNKDKIERLQAVGKERRDEPTRYPLRDRKQVAETQEHLWFTRILFAEAANQPLRAKEAVAQVVVNRSKSGRYPNSIMGVIVQARQFSGYNSRLWRMSEHPDDMNAINRRAYLQCSDVATRAIAGQLPNHVGSATLYHDDSISLPWNPQKVRHVADIGSFSFYQEIR